MNQDQHTQSDVVLRASDGNVFYAWKTFLSFSSPVFRDMFALPQPDAMAQHDGRPIVELTENGSTIGHILSLCQPPSFTGKQFKVDYIKELQDVLEATTKYDMENARSTAVEKLVNPSFLREDPLRIFVLVCQYGCREAAQLAAKHTLVLPALVHSYVPELEKVNAGHLCRLLLYREACISAACSLTCDHTWVMCTDLSALFGCVGQDGVEYTTVGQTPSRKHQTTRRLAVHNWWLEYLRKAGDMLRRSPHGDAVREKSLVNDVRGAISSSKCKRCDELEVWETLRHFVDVLAKEVDSRIAKVEINVGF